MAPTPQPLTAAREQKMEKGSKSQLFIWIAQAAGARIVTRGDRAFAVRARATTSVHTGSAAIVCGCKGNESLRRWDGCENQTGARAI